MMTVGMMELIRESAIVFIIFVGLIDIYSVLASMEDLQSREVNNRKNVNIRPGAGRQEIEDQRDGFLCNFQYKAQGGTNEDWSLFITTNDDNSELMCTIERPSGLSYLFFEEFKFKFSGANLERVFLEKEPGVALSNGEYMIVKDENFVKDWPGKFNSQLTKVQIYGTTKRTEGKEL